MLERYDIYVSVSQRITKGLLIMLEWQSLGDRGNEPGTKVFKD